MLLLTLVGTFGTVHAQEAPGAERQAKIRYYQTSWSFDQVDVSTLTRRLKRVGVTIPVELTGRISGTLSVGVPWNSLRDGKAWRLGGVLTSNNLTVGGVSLNGVVVDLQYRDGVLALDQLAIDVPSPPDQAQQAKRAQRTQQAAAGNRRKTLTGTARMELIPRGSFTATAELAGFEISTLAPVVELLAGVGGNLSGSLTAEVPVDELRNPQAWKLQARLQLREFMFPPISESAMGDPTLVAEATQATADLQIDLTDGVLSANEFVAKLGETEATGNAILTLESSLPWTAATTIDTTDTASLLALIGTLLDSEAMASISKQFAVGTAQTSVELSGVLAPAEDDKNAADEPAGPTVSGHAILKNVAVQLPEQATENDSGQLSLKPLNLDRVEFDYKLVYGKLNDRKNIDQKNTGKVLQLSEIVADIAQGTLAGNLVVPLEKGQYRADINWKNLDIAQLLTKTNQAGGNLISGGVSQGNVSVVIPSDALQSPESWQLTGNLSLSELGVNDFLLREITGSVKLEQGRLTAPDVAAQLNGEPVRLNLDMQLGDPHSLVAGLDVARLDLAQLASIPALRTSALGRTLSGAKGDVALTAELSGSWQPLNLTGSGRVVANELSVAGVTVDSLQFNFNVDRDTLKLSSLEMHFYDGQVTGAVTVPLHVDAAGSASVRWQEISVGTLLTQFAQLPTTFTGQTSGNVVIEIPSETLQRPAAWNFTATVDLPDLRSHGVAVAALTVNAQQNLSRLTYNANGTLLQGKLTLQGERPAEQQKAGGLASLGNTNVQLDNASLALAAKLFADRPATAPVVTGELSFDLRTEVTAEDAPNDMAWQAGVTLSAVTVSGREMTSGVDLKLAGTEQQVRLASLSGGLAGGRLAASGDWQVVPRQAGDFRLRLRGAELEKLAMLADLDDAPFAGEVNVELRISPGDLWRVRGKVGLPRTDYAGTTFRNARIPVSATWHPGSGRLQARLGGANFTVAGGRVTGRLNASYATRWRLDGKFRFYRINAAQLTGSDYGQGRLNGTLEISGRNVRSVNDLQGKLVANLEQTQVANVPLIRQIRNYVPGMPSGATRFSEGRLEASLGRGVIRLEELSLASSRISLFADGQITLAGRLRLEAVVSTGDRSDTVQAQVLLTRLALSSVAPISLLTTANDLLANRVVYLAIGGTVSKPSVRLRPAKILREEAIRFFLRQATGAVLPVGGVSAAAGPN